MDNEEWLDYDEEDAATHDSSFPESFSQILLEQLCQSMGKSLCEIGRIWTKVGIPIVKRDQKIEQLRSSILENVTQFHEAEEQNLKKQQQYRDYQFNEINKILTALSLELYKLDTSKTLMAQNKALNLKYKELLSVKTERFDQLEAIEAKLKKVDYLLGVDYIRTTFATNIPSESELMTIRSHLAGQEQVLDARKRRFESTRASVAKYQRELEYVPQDNSEKILLSSPSSELIYSQQNLNLMADIHKKLIEMFNKANDEINTLKTQLSKLFERLEIEDSVRQSFWSSLSIGSLPRKKALLEAEIDRYEELKKSCMEKIIRSIRKDIGKLQESCMVIAFNEEILVSENYSEDLLLEHEREFNELNKFNEIYREAFDKLCEWKKALEQLFEIEKKALDPNRFNNRGGALLQDERDRKMLNRKLPKLEKDIRSIVTMKESKENIPFSKYGLDIDKYFESVKDSKDDAMKLISAKNRPGATGIGTGGCNSSKKSTATLSSQKKPRVALSPRMNNQNTNRPTNQLASRRLFGAAAATQSNSAIPHEEEFRRCLNNDLHSTMLRDDQQTPGFKNLKMSRRLSKSMDNINEFNRMVTKRPKRPFLP